MSNWLTKLNSSFVQQSDALGIVVPELSTSDGRYLQKNLQKKAAGPPLTPIGGIPQMPNVMGQRQGFRPNTLQNQGNNQQFPQQLPPNIQKPSVVAQVGRQRGGEQSILANIRDMFTGQQKQANGRRVAGQVLGGVTGGALGALGVGGLSAVIAGLMNKDKFDYNPEKYTTLDKPIPRNTPGSVVLGNEVNSQLGGLKENIGNVTSPMMTAGLIGGAAGGLGGGMLGQRLGGDIMGGKKDDEEDLPRILKYSKHKESTAFGAAVGALVVKQAAVHAMGDPLPKDWNHTSALPSKRNGGIPSYGAEAWNSMNDRRHNRSDKQNFDRAWHTAKGREKYSAELDIPAFLKDAPRISSAVAQPKGLSIAKQAPKGSLSHNLRIGDPTLPTQPIYQKGVPRVYPPYATAIPKPAPYGIAPEAKAKSNETGELAGWNRAVNPNYNPHQ